jgi:hypothetical protein
MESTNRLRIMITNTWPRGLWSEVILRFACPFCGAEPGRACFTPSVDTAPHSIRMLTASAAVVAADEKGEDPCMVGTISEPDPEPAVPAACIATRCKKNITCALFRMACEPDHPLEKRSLLNCDTYISHVDPPWPLLPLREAQARAKDVAKC